MLFTVPSLSPDPSSLSICTCSRVTLWRNTAKQENAHIRITTCWDSSAERVSGLKRLLLLCVLCNAFAFSSGKGVWTPVSSTNAHGITKLERCHLAYIVCNRWWHYDIIFPVNHKCSLYMWKGICVICVCIHTWFYSMFFFKCQMLMCSILLLFSHYWSNPEHLGSYRLLWH